MSIIDYRDQEPAWVKYAEYIGGGSDKFYEVRVDLHDSGVFILTKRWGRRPDTGAGQIKVEQYSTLAQATGRATGWFREKLRKGYVECERPYGASGKVAKEYGPDYYREGEEAF